MPQRTVVITAAIGLIVAVGLAVVLLWPRAEWTSEEVVVLRGLSLSSLAPLAPDPSNRFADDPQAVVLGQQLFFDTRFSSNGKVACATCHVPAQGFQDSTPLAHGVGTTARTPSCSRSVAAR